MNVCWENSESYLLINPSYSKNDQKRFHAILESADAWSGHIWLSTSGSSVQKWVGLSKKAILASAQAVNQHLDASQKDRWVNALPSFHVGGLGVWARSHLNGSLVFDFKEHFPGKWKAEEYYHYLEQVKGTLSALVPTQLHDLIVLGKPAPTCLRALIIGGGSLLPDLYEKAIALRWPVLPSYGLTECASQVATAALDSWQQNAFPSLQLLSHVQASEREGRLCFKGPSLLSTYAYLEAETVKFVDPKNQEWFVSEDRGEIRNGGLAILGRADAVLKVCGENVDIARLENLLQTLCIKLAIEAEVTLLPLPDLRLGHRILFISNCCNQGIIAPLIEQFQSSVLPFERIRGIHFLQKFPRSAIGKVLKNELFELLNPKFRLIT